MNLIQIEIISIIKKNVFQLLKITFKFFIICIAKLTCLHPYSFTELRVNIEQANGADFELERGGGIQVGHDKLRLAGVGKSQELRHRNSNFDSVYFLVINFKGFSVNFVLCRTCSKS